VTVIINKTLIIKQLAVYCSPSKFDDYESSVLLFFIAVCQVVMANTLFVAKLLLNKVTDPMISYSNIRSLLEI
jgi:hypothetical protein